MMYNESPKCKAAEKHQLLTCTGKYNFILSLKQRRGVNALMLPSEVWGPDLGPTLTYLNRFFIEIRFKNNSHTEGFTLGQTLHKTKRHCVGTPTMTLQWEETTSTKFEQMSDIRFWTLNSPLLNKQWLIIWNEWNGWASPFRTCLVNSPAMHYAWRFYQDQYELLFGEEQKHCHD